MADVDPIEYDLTFERFLNPERMQMPDIDMDFQDDRRDEVIEYVTQKYGADRVAQIVTFGRLGARAAIRDVGRAMGMPLPEVDKVAKLVPTAARGDDHRQGAGRQPRAEGDLRRRGPDASASSTPPRAWRGWPATPPPTPPASSCPGDPLTEVVPIQPVQKSSKGERPVMCQYSMKPLEKIGLLKMDFLGLNNLTILANTLNCIKQDPGQGDRPAGHAPGRPGDLRDAEPGGDHGHLPAGRHGDAPLHPGAASPPRSAT